jgi:Ca-activated chloride channel family protein
VQVLTRETELAGVLALISALIAATAAMLSLLWFGRVA